MTNYLLRILHSSKLRRCKKGIKLHLCFIWWQIAHLVDGMGTTVKSSAHHNCCYNRCLPYMYVGYMVALIEKQSSEVFAEYFYDISLWGSGIRMAGVEVQSYKHRLTVHLPVPRGPCIKHSQTWMILRFTIPSSLVDVRATWECLVVVNFNVGNFFGWL